ncbi:pectate lyase [Phocaeicola coprocola]
MRLKKYLFLLCIPMSGWAQQVPSTMLLQDGIHHWNLLHPNRSYMRYAETDYEKIADNLIAYQNLDGGWLKNIDWLGVLNSDSVKATLNDFEKQSTLDNRNTFSQIEYLADTYVLTNKLKYRLAVEKGLDYLLDTQKENGGWRGWDVDAVTFNDDVTTGALELCRNILP